ELVVLDLRGDLRAPAPPVGAIGDTAAAGHQEGVRQIRDARQRAHGGQRRLRAVGAGGFLVVDPRPSGRATRGAAPRAPRGPPARPRPPPPAVRPPPPRGPPRPPAGPPPAARAAGACRRPAAAPRNAARRAPRAPRASAHPFVTGRAAAARAGAPERRRS